MIHNIDYLKSLNFNNPDDWKLISGDILLAAELINQSLFPENKIQDLPNRFFTSSLFCLKVFSYYHPPLNKINFDIFNDEILLMDLSNKYPYALKHVPSQYITQNFLSWYITNNYSNKDYLKYIKLDNLTEELAHLIIEKSPSSFSYIKDKFTYLDFYQNIPSHSLAKIYDIVPDVVRKNFDILKKVISKNPTCYMAADPEFFSFDYFKELANINPYILKHSPISIKNNFECALFAIIKEPSLLEETNLLNNDLEFFFACQNNLKEKIHPYLQYFSRKIFSDAACVRLVLDNLILSNRIGLLEEPVTSDPEIMFSVISKHPKNFQYVSDNLAVDVTFFNRLQYNLKELSLHEPMNYIWFDMFQELIENIPDTSLNDTDFVINLYFTNPDHFTQFIYPIISKHNTDFMNTLKEFHVSANINFNDFFLKYKHEKELFEQLKNIHKEKIPNKTEKPIRKI